MRKNKLLSVIGAIVIKTKSTSSGKFEVLFSYERKYKMAKNTFTKERGGVSSSGISYLHLYYNIFFAFRQVVPQTSLIFTFCYKRVTIKM